MRIMRRRERVSFESPRMRVVRGGDKLLVALEHPEHFVQPITLSEKPDIANCLRARAALNATDNSLIEYEGRTNRGVGQSPGAQKRSTD